MWKELTKKHRIQYCSKLCYWTQERRATHAGGAANRAPSTQTCLFHGMCSFWAPTHRPLSTARSRERPRHRASQAKELLQFNVLKSRRKDGCAADCCAAQQLAACVSHQHPLVKRNTNMQQGKGKSVLITDYVKVGLTTKKENRVEKSSALIEGMDDSEYA